MRFQAVVMIDGQDVARYTGTLVKARAKGLAKLRQRVGKAVMREDHYYAGGRVAGPWGDSMVVERASWESGRMWPSRYSSTVRVTG